MSKGGIVALVAFALGVIGVRACNHIRFAGEPVSRAIYSADGYEWDGAPAATVAFLSVLPEGTPEDRMIATLLYEGWWCGSEPVGDWDRICRTKIYPASKFYIVFEELWIARLDFDGDRRLAAANVGRAFRGL